MLILIGLYATIITICYGCSRVMRGTLIKGTLGHGRKQGHVTRFNSERSEQVTFTKFTGKQTERAPFNKILPGLSRIPIEYKKRASFLYFLSYIQLIY